MKIVIDIPEEIYGDAKENKDYGKLVNYLGVYSEKLDKILFDNAIVLPKGHGNLIDRDALIYNADYYEPLISKRDVDFAPTIIEGE